MNPETFADAALKLFEVIRDSLSVLSDRWEFAVALFALLFGVSHISRAKPYVSVLLFPSLLLLLRKVALFVPISGAISSEDRIVFWSRGAYWYLLIMLAVHILILLGIRYREKVEWGEGIGCFIFLVPVGLMILSSVLLPVDGWSHLYMPVVSLLGAVKALLVSPMLLPLAWVALLIQIGLVLLGTTATGREINKLALMLILVGGLSQFGLQAAPSQSPPLVEQIGRKWQTVNPSATEETGFGANKRIVYGGETSDFLGAWARKLPDIYRLRLNIVEKSFPDTVEGASDLLHKALHPPTDWWPNLSLQNAVVIGGGLLALLVLFERFRIAGEKEPASPQ